MKHTIRTVVHAGLAFVVLALATTSMAGSSVRVAAQVRSTTPQQNRGLDGTPLNPLAEFERRAEQEAKDKRFRELKTSAVELAELSRKVSDEIEKGGQNVISAKVFENLDKIEKLVKQVRNKAKDGL